MVELLVVIAIIGILSTLLLLQLNVARQKARDAKRVADVNQIRSALELYYDDNGYYLENNTMAVLTAGLGKYLTRVPTDPGRADCDSATHTAGYDGNATVLAGCYGYAWDLAAKPTKFHLWAELEQKAASALGNDLDANSTATGVNSKNFASGAKVVGASELCTDSTLIDCVYDVGQPD